MYLLFDIGNSYTKIALIKDYKILKKVEIETVINLIKKDLIKLIKDNFEVKNIKSVFVSYVVFDAYKLIYQLIKNNLNLDITVLSYLNTNNIGNKIKNKKEVGTDLILNSAYKDGLNLVIDMGTVTKYLLINNNKLIGASFTPSITSKNEVLDSSTYFLPKINLKKGNLLIGNDTISAINTGLFNGSIYEINGFIDAIKNKYPKINIYLTGGNSIYFKDEFKNINYDEFLTFKGMINILIERKMI